jgi:hypothetical protein
MQRQAFRVMKQASNMLFGLTLQNDEKDNRKDGFSDKNFKCKFFM